MNERPDTVVDPVIVQEDDSKTRIPRFKYLLERQGYFVADIDIRVPSEVDLEERGK